MAETRATTIGAETVEQVVQHQSKFWASLHAKEMEDGEVITYLMYQKYCLIGGRS